MQKAKVVIGGAFGDEGKGLFTDYFANAIPNSLVIRFNGGAQAGHTVVTPEGNRHVFGHFGSGSFAKVPTYLSKFFIVNPIVFAKELAVLKKKGVDPSVLVSPNCIVTTPYDMLVNQIVEEYRDANRHGSCGIGINETIRRNQVLPINVHDLRNPLYLVTMLDNIRSKYVPERLKVLGVDVIPVKYLELLQSDNIIRNFMEDCKNFISSVSVERLPDFSKYETLVFEGAQGLQLDQNSKNFPFVTPSNTGMANVLEIISDFKLELDVETVYLTRSYTTRHGAGNFPYELKEKPFKKILDMTNVPNDFQGTLRFSHLNLDELIEAINKDKKDMAMSIGISCVDQVDDENSIPCIYNGEEVILSLEGIRDTLWLRCDTESFYISRGMTRETVTV